MEIPVTIQKKSGTALVSVRDREQTISHNWHVNNDGYVVNRNQGKLHHFIMGKPRDGFVWDHKNGNKLDNRRENLFEATFSQNAQNAPKKQGTSSEYIGVNWREKCKKWYVTCQRKHYGNFESEIDAGKMYDTVAYHIFGEHARTNNLLSDIEKQRALEMTDVQVNVQQKSSFGKGIKFYRNRYCVEICHDYLGCYKTLEEAQEVSRKYVEDKEKRRIDSIYALDIERNDDGVPVVPINSNKGIVAYALVLEAHWHDLMLTKWSFNKNKYPQGYRDKKPILMHRYIYLKYVGKVPKGYVIDHIGLGETDSLKKRLDNRLTNLRLLTLSENAHNKVGVKNTSSPYLGVSKTQYNRYMVHIMCQNVDYYLGTFPTEREAAEAYNTKALELFGATARLNMFEVDDPEILAPVVEFVPVEVDDDTGVVSG